MREPKIMVRTCRRALSSSTLGAEASRVMGDVEAAAWAAAGRRGTGASGSGGGPSSEAGEPPLLRLSICAWTAASSSSASSACVSASAAAACEIRFEGGFQAPLSSCRSPQARS